MCLARVRFVRGNFNATLVAHPFGTPVTEAPGNWVVVAPSLPTASAALHHDENINNMRSSDKRQAAGSIHRQQKKKKNRATRFCHKYNEIYCCLYGLYTVIINNNTAAGERGGGYRQQLRLVFICAVYNTFQRVYISRHRRQLYKLDNPFNICVYTITNF